ncbi:hypothetical protein WICMUC_000612 [Wickerhamomyces mucosus]|uniref:Dienelactone hydrolase domain-containing protein n=1 Tax=Wickerhamomyces mucosus TaxID=1378264 RepID=A0A9P8PYZ8_9ASCO|nr:hypothetical protein WICMUC_000612 [Wickerhamomyces mucosus]
MLITESFHDVTTSYGTILRLYSFHPNIPNYPLARFPAVIVWSEIYQVTGPVSRFAKKIASDGFIVICPSIYHNFVGPEPLAYDVKGTDDGNKYKIEKPLESYDEDAKLAIDYLETLKTFNGKVGSTGMCLGGHLAFRTAFDNRVSAAVCFFATDIHSHSLGKGMNDDSLIRSAELKRKNSEIILIFGTLDNHVPPEGRDLIRKTLRDQGVDFTFLEVNGAQHAFVRDESSKGRYDAAITSACFGFLSELFERRLKLDYGEYQGGYEVENVC